MTLTFRPADDTNGDAAFFTWGLNEAMDGLLDIMFGARSRETYPGETTLHQSTPTGLRPELTRLPQLFS